MSPEQLFPATGPWKEIRLSEHASLIRDNPRGLWVHLLKLRYGGEIQGGYLEDRSIFFDERHDPQAVIHLGVDLWLPAGTKVNFPLLGAVRFSRGPTDTVGGWGGRLDIETADGHIHIFGHLAQPSLRVSDIVRPDTILGVLAPRETNGGWWPHLHVQKMTKDAYASFSDPNDIDAYAPLAPDLAARYPHPFGQT